MTSSISSSYASTLQRSLSYFLGSSSSSSSTSSSSDSDGTDLASLLQANMGMRDYTSSSSDTSGVVLATVDEMDSVTSPVSKLTLANGVAKSLLIQADASANNNNAKRVSTIAEQASQVLDAMTSAVASLKKSDSSGQSLAACQSTISTALGSINKTLTQISGMMRSVSSDEKANLTASLSSMDTTAAALAKAADVSWTSITGASGNSYISSTASATTASSSSVSSLVDILA